MNPAIPAFRGHATLRPTAVSVVVFMYSENPAQRRSTTSSWPRMRAIPGASSSLAVRRTGRKRQHRRVQSAFESQRLSELAAWLPEFAERIEDIQSSPVGLASRRSKPCLPSRIRGVILAEGGAACARAEMTYEGMEVANGQDAGLAWESLVRGGLDQSERERIRKALLDYCGQDTLALVRLAEMLRARVH